ncbi:MAG: condensation domain-containing protein, partial [Rhodospirillales bacterium]
HISTDGASSPVMYSDLSYAYRNRVQGITSFWDEEIQSTKLKFYDWATWYSEKFATEVEESALTRVLDRLSNPPLTLSLPEDFVRQDPNGFIGEMLRVAISEELINDLRNKAREQNSTLFMVLLTGLGLYLSRLSGEDDIILGTPVSLRDHPDLQELVGFMVNTVPIRLRVQNHNTV